jgi:hypothetical protein
MNRTRDPYFPGALLTMDTYLAYINQQSAPHIKYEACEEVFSKSYVVFHYHEKSYMTERIDSVLSRLLAGGILKFYYSTYIDDKYLKYDNSDKGPKQFNNYDLSFMYEVCSFGIALSLITFLLELLSVKFKIVKQFLDYFN